MIAPRLVRQVGILKRIRIVFPEWVSGNEHAKWSAGLNRQDAPGFPVAENCLGKSSEGRGSGNVPDIIHRQVVPLVLIGQRTPASLAEPEQRRDRIPERIGSN